MPTYDYRCPNGHDFERFFRKISDAASELACPVCGATAERRVSGGAGLVFKGSGFYLTDYGKNAHRKGGPEPSSSSSTGDSKSGTSEGSGSGGSGGSGGSDGGAASSAKSEGGSAAAKSESAKSAESKPASSKPKGGDTK